MASVESGTTTLGVIKAEDKGVIPDSSPTHSEEDPEWRKYPVPSPPLLSKTSNTDQKSILDLFDFFGGIRKSLSVQIYLMYLGFKHSSLNYVRKTTLVWFTIFEELCYL